MKGEYTLAALPRTITSQNLVLFQVRRNAEAFHSLITSLLEILGCPDSCLIPPAIQQRRNAYSASILANPNLQLQYHIARAYPELRCTFGGRSVVPNIAVFIWERIPRDETGKVSNTFAIAPDWTIEILSPDQSQTKVVRNILHCLANGTQMGWLIDPEEELVFVYFADRTLAVFEDSSDRIPVPTFAEDVHLTIGQLFEWLQE